MTRLRNDKNSTEFGLWVRGSLGGQKTNTTKFNSTKGQGNKNASNLDYIWEDYSTKYWVAIEEKRYGKSMTWPQWCLFKKIDICFRKACDKYLGFFFIQFEHTNPEDGAMWINYRLSSIDDVVNLLALDLNWIKHNKSYDFSVKFEKREFKSTTTQQASIDITRRNLKVSIVRVNHQFGIFNI